MSGESDSFQQVNSLKFLFFKKIQMNSNFFFFEKFRRQWCGNVWNFEQRIRIKMERKMDNLLQRLREDVVSVRIHSNFKALKKNKTIQLKRKSKFGRILRWTDVMKKHNLFFILTGALKRGKKIRVLSADWRPSRNWKTRQSARQ